MTYSRRASTSSQELLGQSLLDLMCSICRVRGQEMVNIMTPLPPPEGEEILGVKRVQLLYFLFLNSQALIRQTKYVEMMPKEGSTKIVNFHDPGAGVLVLGLSHISHIVKIQYFFKNLLLLMQV